MIKIIDDTKKILNLNPLVIYFFFSSEEKQKYEIIIDSLNQNNALTLGVFKFRAVTRSQDPELNAMLGDVIPANGGNMLVRFFDRTEEAFSYGLTDIDFSLPKKEIERRITAEVKEIARIDLRNLKDYAQSGCDQDEASLFNEMARLLEEALTNDIGSDLKSDFLSLYIDSNDLGRSLPPGFMSDISRLKKWGKNKDVEVEGFFEEFNNLLEEYGISSEEESEEILTSPEKLKSDFYTRNEPEYIPKFAIEVKEKEENYVKKCIFKVLQNDDEKGEINFEYKDPKILFLTLLLCTAFNVPIYRKDFLFKNEGPGIECLKFAFQKITRGGNFNKWLEKMANNNQQPLSQAKSRCNSIIGSALSKIPQLNYYCQIQVKRGKGNYFLHLQPDQIKLPEEWKLNNELRPKS